MRTTSAAPRVSTIIGLGVAALLFACGGGSDAPPTPPTPTGSLSVTGCVIAADASSCQATISWTSAGAAAPRVLVGGVTLATTTAGTASTTLGTAAAVVTLLDGAVRLDEKSVAGTCASASAWDGARCLAFARRADARAPTPFIEDGQPVSLEVVIYKPLGAGPFPLVMFNHGSTGNGDDPSLFKLTYTHEGIARFFAERGWMVAFPQRRGRGASGGLYDEGFVPDRSRYSCLQAPALAGIERALQDADAAFDYLRSHPDVDSTRVLAAGFSRGGILALAHAARRPGAFRGAVNFVGGWIGEGCVDAVAVNRSTFASASTFAGATIWLYGENDPFYSLEHSRANFDAFVGAGGKGALHVYTRAPGLSGHLIINEPSLWAPALDAYLTLSGG